MTWGKLSGDMAFHRKVLLAFDRAGSNDPVGAWARGLSWSSENLTNGFVPQNVWALICGTRWRKVVGVLVDVGLLDVAEGGWEIHDFLQHNPSKSAVKLRQEKRAELRGQELCNAVKRRDRSRCRYCRVKVKWTDKRGDNGGTYDHVNPGLAEGIDNLVVACRRDNRKKWKRTPEQAGMELLPEWTAADIEAFAAEEDLGSDLAPDSSRDPSSDSSPDLPTDLSPDDLAGTYHRDGTGELSKSGRAKSGSGRDVSGASPGQVGSPPEPAVPGATDGTGDVA